MKTRLRALAIVALSFTLTYQASAQSCSVSKAIIENVVPLDSRPGFCMMSLDLTFTINDANPYIFFNSWMIADYPDYFQCINGHTTRTGDIPVPMNNTLGNAIINIGIDNSSGDPVLLSTYPWDPAVTMTSVGAVYKQVDASGNAEFFLDDVIVTVPVECGKPSQWIADVWTAGNLNNGAVDCVNCGLVYESNYINVLGAANCSTQTWRAQLCNNTFTNAAGHFVVYADVNQDGNLNPMTDVMIQDSTHFVCLGSGIGSCTTVSGTIPQQYVNMDLFIVVTLDCGCGGSGISRAYLLPTTLCAPLPVTFDKFTATRTSRTTVDIMFRTATEINNSGFAIQRNTGGTWETVTFIPSQAMGGNSNSLLTYTFTDRNEYRGISQYRIRQVDIDGKAKYSEIRAVRGESQQDKVVVYPNPANGGRANIVFDNSNSIRDVVLIDNNGRIVKQWKGVTGNTVQVENVSAGMYSIRIYNRETGQQQVEKLIMLK